MSEGSATAGLQTGQSSDARESSERIHWGVGSCIGCAAPNAEHHLVGCPIGIEQALVEMRAAAITVVPRIVPCKACDGTGVWSKQYPNDARSNRVCHACNGAGVHRV